MNKKIIKILAFVMILICTMIIRVQNVYATEISQLIPQKEEVFNSANSSFVNDYYEMFYSGEKEILVTDHNNNDVTNYYLSKTISLYKEGDLDGIKKFIANKGYRLHLITEKNEVMLPYALEQYKTVTDTIVEYYTDNQYGTVMEFMATLTGGLWYNPNTYEVTRTSSPVFNVNVMNVPMGITPLCNNIQTGSNVSGGKGYFFVTYSLAGLYKEEQGPIVITYNYGTHTFSFHATA